MQRRRFDSAFKGKVALEVIKKNLTIADLERAASLILGRKMEEKKESALVPIASSGGLLSSPILEECKDQVPLKCMMI